VHLVQYPYSSASWVDVAPSVQFGPQSCGSSNGHSVVLGGVIGVKQLVGDPQG